MAGLADGAAYGRSARDRRGLLLQGSVGGREPGRCRSHRAPGREQAATLAINATTRAAGAACAAIRASGARGGVRARASWLAARRWRRRAADARKDGRDPVRHVDRAVRCFPGGAPRSPTLPPSTRAETPRSTCPLPQSRSANGVRHAGRRPGPRPGGNERSRVVPSCQRPGAGPERSPGPARPQNRQPTLRSGEGCPIPRPGRGLLDRATENRAGRAGLRPRQLSQRTLAIGRGRRGAGGAGRGP